MGLAAVKVDFQREFASCCCSRCGMDYYVPRQWQDNRREQHDGFYCPNGHAQYYPQETAAEKAERKASLLAEQVRMEREQREKLERQLKRVGKGTCPKCNRHFANVERHMKSKHKEC